ncbi:hypothetical protein, partial [Mycobacterium marinum]
MDVVLGVAIAGPIARLALVGAAAEGSAVIDQSSVDLAEGPVAVLTETIVGTNQLLADEGHHLVATRLCWSDQDRAEDLRRALDDSGVLDVAVLSESEAVTALLGQAHAGSAVLLVGEETASLSVLGGGDAPPTMLAAAPVEGDATSTFDTLMAHLDDQGGAPGEVLLVGSSEHTTVIADQFRDASTMRVEVPEDPTFALARGAAMAAAGAGSTMAQQVLGGDAGEATTYLPPELAATASGQDEDEQLAYSQAGENELLPVTGADEYGDYGPDDDEFADDYEDEAPAGTRLSSRSLLISNAVVAFAVIGFASLAVAVAVAIRPTAASEPVEGHQNAQPGKFMPLLPTQQQAPVPPPPPDAPTAGFQGGTIPTVQGVVPRQATPTVPAPVAPAPAPAPGVVPAPIPLPIPIIIPPWPNWSPGMPTPSTVTVTPTTPTTTAPSTVTPTTPTTTAPSTLTPTTPTTTAPSTLTPTTPTTTVPSTVITPTTTAPITPTTVAPTTVNPTTVAPTTVAPTTQQTVVPQPTQ